MYASFLQCAKHLLIEVKLAGSGFHQHFCQLRLIRKIKNHKTDIKVKQFNLPADSGNEMHHDHEAFSTNASVGNVFYLFFLQ